MSFPFNFITKISEDHHFTVTGSKILKLLSDTPFGTSFQNDVLVSLQLFPFVCNWVVLSYVQWNKIASLTACNFHNSWPLHFKCLKTKKFAEIFDRWKIEIVSFFSFEIKRAKMDKIFNFLNGRFSVMSGPTDMIFGVFPKTNVRLLKNIISHFFSKYSKSYKILNVKSCLNSKVFWGDPKKSLFCYI